MTNPALLVMMVELECGHQSMAGWPEVDFYMPCFPCDARILLTAVETREYKFRCRGCKLSRWCGQDSQPMIITKHFLKTGHADYALGYERVPVKTELVRDMFGRRVKNIIPRINVNPSPQGESVYRKLSLDIRQSINDSPPF